MSDVTTLVLIGLAGATLSVSTHHLSFWVERRSAALHGWVGLWAGAAFLQQVARVAHYAATEEAGAVLALKLSMAAIVLCGAVAPYAVHSLAGPPGTPRGLRWLLPVHVLLIALVLGTDLIFASAANPYVDASGRAFLWVDPGPVQWLMLPWGLFLVVYAIRAVWRSTSLDRAERRTLAACFLAYVALGVNDNLVALELIDSVLTFDYSFALIVFGFAWLAARRFEALHGHLEDEVATRTQELELALAKAREASDARSRFLANITHEIRTPLHGLQATTDLLAETAAGSDQRRLTRIAQRSTQELRRLVDDVLDTSAIEAGRLALHPAPIDAGPLVEETIAAWRPGASASRIALNLDMDQRPIGVLADDLRLRQVLGNLLSNAIKFTDAGQVTLSVRKMPDGVRFAVSDTGPGLDPDAHERIFEAFHQEADAPGGTGLGLTIASALVQGMGGSLEVDSSPDWGAEFSFTLPAATPRVRRLPARFAAGTVLVADDHPVNREIARIALARDGIEVEDAADGYEAVARVLRGGIDLVLMDLRMPGLGGVEAVRRIRSARASVHVPIVALTASTTRQEHEAFLDAGAQEVVIKPLDVAGLRAVVSRYVEISGVTDVSDSLVGDLRKMFAEDALARLDPLDSDSTPEAIRAASHAIRGAAATLGDQDVVALCQDLEARPDDPAGRLHSLRERLTAR